MPAATSDVEAAAATEQRSSCWGCFVHNVVFGQCIHWCGLNIRTATVAVMCENLILAVVGLFSANLMHIDEFYGTLQSIVGISGIVAAALIFMSTTDSGATGSSFVLKVALVMLFLISVWWVVSIVALYDSILSLTERGHDGVIGLHVATQATRATVGGMQASPGPPSAGSPGALDWVLAGHRGIMILVQSVTIINHMLLAYLVSKAMGAQEVAAAAKLGPKESDPLKGP